jgi:hypothetical protein
LASRQTAAPITVESTGSSNERRNRSRGLNRNRNHDLKNLFNGAAIVASSKPRPFQEFYTAVLTKGHQSEKIPAHTIPR